MGSAIAQAPEPSVTLRVNTQLVQGCRGLAGVSRLTIFDIEDKTEFRSTPIDPGRRGAICPGRVIRNRQQADWRTPRTFPERAGAGRFYTYASAPQRPRNSTPARVLQNPLFAKARL